MDIKYIKDDFQFIYRTSALIFNEDETKLLLFNVEGRNFFMPTGGKVNQLEESLDAIKREIKEELGWDNLDYSFLAISEEFVNDKGLNNQQINLIYKAIYKGEINENRFKGLEGDWINFEWIDTNNINNYEIYPIGIKKLLSDTNKIYHIIDNEIAE